MLTDDGKPGRIRPAPEDHLSVPPDPVRRGLLRRAVALMPDALEAHNQLGTVLQQLGRLDEACAAFAAAATANPTVAVFHSNLGAVLGLLNRDTDAMRAFERAVALDPTLADAHDNLGILMRRYGRLDTALACFERALAAQPNHVTAHNNLGMVLQSLTRHDEAIAQIRQALALRPDYAEAHNNLGNSLMAIGRHEAAIASYETALRLRPNLAQAHYNLGNALVASGQPDAAVGRYQRALALQPAYAEAHNNLGNVLVSLGREADAAASYERAVALDPGLSDAYARLAGTLGSLGRFDEARAHLKRAIEIAPDNVLLRCRFAATKRFTAGDPDLAALEGFVRNEAGLPDDDRTALHFTLGKAYDEIGEPERAFDHLLTGNALKRRRVEHDEAGVIAQFERTRALFTDAVLARHRGAGAPSSAPIFIVGMPRSGTTLVEQILASHPAVFGAGELSSFPDVVDRHAAAARTGFPELIETLDDAALGRLGAEYLGAVRQLAPDAARIVDKLPGNFVHAGLIHLALPGARLIHTLRDPVDTCVSCFSIMFSTGQHFSYELGELGRYYRAYRALMAHWRAILPSEVLLEVRYEDVVDDLEGQARRIVAHCGLPWDDACLAFHQTQRPVRTASALQVRQPIYRDSVGRWRRFGDRLTPLLDALGPDAAG